MPIHVIGEDGRMTGMINGYGGMTVEECREAFVVDLKEAGRMKEEKKYVQPLSISYRSKKAVEPLPKTQWFIDVNKKVIQWKGRQQSLKDIMQDVVQSGMIEIIPERFGKTYFQWIDNLQDWCVSRQIWWGHRIPVWYKDSETHVGVLPPKGDGWTQDEDTLDTWFSSALWTWSTLIDPKLAEDASLSLADILTGSPDFKKFHPTNVMETGGDILFFWVARMILMTTYALGKIPGYTEEQRLPFKTVYLHGMIMDRNGQKMSKSKPETAIDPLEIIPKYGADALRLSMIVGQSPGNDSRLYEEKIEGYRNFVNKLWNASRFVLMQCEAAKVDPKTLMDLPDLKTLSLADRAMLSREQETVEKVTKALNEYRLSEAGEALYSYVWNDYCDWYLELSKGNANLAVLVHTLRKILRMLHPFCPFVTEELWAQVKPKDYGMLIADAWPRFKPERIDAAAEKDFMALIGVITAIRKLRTEQDVEVGKMVSVVLCTEVYNDLSQREAEHIRRMAKVEHLTVTGFGQKPDDAAAAFLDGIEVYLPLAGLVDKEKEKTKRKKEKEKLKKNKTLCLYRRKRSKSYRYCYVFERKKSQHTGMGH